MYIDMLPSLKQQNCRAHVRVGDGTARVVLSSLHCSAPYQFQMERQLTDADLAENPTKFSKAHVR